MAETKQNHKSIIRYSVLVLFTIILMIICMIGVYKYVSNIVLDANIDTMRELQEHDQKAISASVDRRISDADNLADSLANQSILSIQELHENLNAANYQLKTKKIYLLGDNGKFYSSNGTAKEDEDYFMMVSKYPEGFLDRVPSSSKKFNDGLLLIGRPISGFSVEGIKFSYIITETKLVDLAGELSTSSYNGQGYSNVIDLDGNYIVSEEGKFQENAYEELRMNSTISGESIDSYLNRIINEETTAVTVNHSGVQEICLTMHTPEGWILVSVCPISVFDTESNRISSLFGVLSLFFVAAVAITLVFIMRTHSRKQLQEQFDKIKKLNGELVENQTKLEESVSEQESQLEEITNLNHELEEHQAKLEETASEQESQLEEIATLNRTLISSKEELEYTLKDLEERNDIIRAAGYGIWRFVFDNEGNVCGLLGDDKWAELFGVENDTMTPEERFAYYSKGLDDGINSEVHDDYSFMREGIVKSRIFAWTHPETKEKKYLSVGGTKHIARDGDIQISGYITDVTEETLKQQKWENEIIEARTAAEKANLAKTSFLFNMSHDIRTPMNAILGYTRILEKYVDNPEKVLDYQKKLQKSGEILLELINGVLEMSRIESGHIELNEEYFHTGNFLQEIADVYENEIIEKNLTVVCKEIVQAEHIMLDAAKTHEVISNLIGNAIKYTPAGGTITATTTELQSDREGYVLFQTVVEDNGIGMSEEFLPQVFDSFARERNTTTAKIAGTGLGLSIVKKLVDAMGGSISVESKPGVGTKFTMLLYHKIADETCHREGTVTIPYSSKVNEKGERILLVEDNDFNAEIAMDILTEMGYVVDLAEDGLICIDMLNKAELGYYDLILMDIQMPNLNGYEATKRIRQLPEPEKANIPIIAMTANAFEEDKQKALDSGMNGHIAKPVKVAELMKALAGLLGYD